MGWKSTIDITREEAIQAIINSFDKTKFEDRSNSELERMMYQFNIGDDINKPYFGHNFNIHNSKEDIDEIKKLENY
jgi:hypothetical protein